MLLAVVNWVGPNNGAWGTAINWLDDTGVPRLPTATDDVVISQAGITVVHSTGTDSVRSLTSQGNLQVSGGTLTLAAAGVTSEVDGTLTLSAGATLTGPGDLAVGSPTDPAVVGALVWLGGTMSGGGTTVVAAGSSLTLNAGGTIRLDGRALTNAGTATWPSSLNAVAFTLSNGATFTNQAGATLDIRAGGAATLGSGGGTVGFTNAGTVHKQFSSNTTAIQVPFTNTGSVSAAAGTLSVRGGGSAVGTFTALPMGTLDFQNGYTLGAGSAVSGDGTVSFTGGSATTVAGSYSVRTTSLTGGQVDFNSPAATSRLSMSGGTLGGSGALTLTGGTSSWTGGTMTGTGSTTVAPGARLTLNTGGTISLNSGRVLTNHGTITWPASSNNVAFNLNTGSSFTNAADGFVTVASGATATVGPSSGGGTFTNAGTLTRTAATGTTPITVPFTSSGTVDVQKGTLSVRGGGSSGGVFTLQTAGTLDFQNTYSLTATSGVTGLGTVSFTNTGTTTAAGTYNVGTTSISGGGPLLNGPATSGRLVMSGGTLGGSGALTLTTGTSSWTAGTMSGPGSTIVAAGASLTLNTVGTVTLDAGRTLRNLGTVLWPNSSNAVALALRNSSGFHNEVGALFDIHAGGAAGINDSTPATPGLLTNAGTVRKSVNTATTTVQVPFANTGVVDVRLGNLTIQGTLPTDGQGILTGLPFGMLTVAGNLSGTTGNADLFAPEATVTLSGGTAGSPRLFEVMGVDRGNAAAGFDDNFAFNKVTLASSTFVRLVNGNQNSPASGSDPEALYVNALVVPAGSTLDLNGFHVYTRQPQIAGTVLNGTVSQLPTAGPLTLGQSAAGRLLTTSQVDDWTFFGRAGQSIAAVVNTGLASSVAPQTPGLNFARVSLRDGQGNVLATTNNVVSGGDVVLQGVLLPADGTYTVRVESLSGSTGYYVVTALDDTTRTTALNLNQDVSGRIDNPYRVERWTFNATAGQQIQFTFLGASSAAIRFDLTGPNGYTAFSSQAGSSSLITLPADGAYVLKAYSLQGQTGTYAFRMDGISVTTLTLGAALHVQFPAGRQARLFKVDVPGGQPLVFNAVAAGNVVEVYLRYGAPPTREAYQYRADRSINTTTRVIAPSAAAGTWYALVYYTGAPLGTVDVTATTGVSIESFSPKRYDASADVTMTLKGAGFDATTTVSLLSGIENQGPPNVTYPAASVHYESPTQITATFTGGSLPTGNYYVVATRADGSTDNLGLFKVVEQGKPGEFHARLSLPSGFNYRTPATLYLSYNNAGDTAIPAPLLVLTATQTHADSTTTAQGLFTLDASQVRRGLYGAGALPAGFSNTIHLLASGETPGALQPGEFINIPVYWAGWQLPWDVTSPIPPFNFSLGALPTDNTELLDWSELGPLLRPDNYSPEAWAPISANLQTQVGPTVGSYVQTLNANAAYLGQFGENVRDPARLWNFEVQRAIGLSPVRQVASVVDAVVPTPGLTLTFERSFSNTIQGHHATGRLGSGWWDSWQPTLTVGPDGTAIVHGQAGVERRFEPDRRGGSFASEGDLGTLTATGGGTFSLREPNGYRTAFRPDGQIGSLEDANGNRITANYNPAGQLVNLTHSAGQSLQFTYNASGRIATITDSDGRTTSYTYDATNERLESVQPFDGREARYTYDTGVGTASSNALLSIEKPDGTHEFLTYDAQGRLSTVQRDGGAGLLTLTYGPGGLVSVTNANGSASKYFFNAQGLIARLEDSLGHATQFSYDAFANLVQVTDSLGQTLTNRYDARGNLVAVTNPAGHTLNFSYSSQLNNLASYTDARGITTRYTYDDRGNLRTTLYADNSLAQSSYDSQGNLTQSINRRGHAVQASYNSSGQVASLDSADGTSLTYGYDTNHNLVTATGAAGTTTVEYETVVVGGQSVITERVARILYPDGRFLQFAYDTAGRRTQSVDQEGFTLNYHYDAAGQLAELTDGNDQTVVTYEYDLTGELIERHLGNGTYTTYEHDPVGQLLHLINHAPDGSVNSRFDYSYDALGRRISATSLDGQWTYTYDPLGQLTRAVFVSNNPGVLPNQDLQYTYDAAGNRTQTVINGETTAYTTNNLNQYVTVGASTYSYDPDGNLITRTDGAGTTTYDYNDLNQLVGIVGPESSWSHTYNPLGFRDSVTHDGQTTQFLFDPVALGNIVAAHDGVGVTNYIHGLGLESQTSGGVSSYFDFDDLGSTVGITGSAGTYLSQYAYLPFGEVVQSVGTATPFGFVGRFGVSADDSGLVNMRMRSYDPITGQFASDDPFGLGAGDSNFRRYVGNSPADSIDPVGLAPGLDWGSTLRDLAVTGQFFGRFAQANAGDLQQSVIAAAELLEAQAAEAAAWAKLPYPSGVPTWYLTPSAAAAAAAARAALAAAAQSVGPTGLALVATDLAVASTAVVVTFAAGYGVGTLLNNYLFTAKERADLGQALYNWDEYNGGNVGNTITTIINALRPFIGSLDPNELLGPGGYGPPRFVAPDALLPYRVNFENDPEATAPAQRVTISNQLDANLDWNTFQFTEVGFGDTLITIPDAVRHYQTTTSMTYNGQTFDVQIELGLDPITGLVSAVFESLDPNTELPPDVLTGFLPPEDGTGRGKGYFSYTILPKAGLPTGTQTRNIALITFDINPPISTDQVDPHDPSQGVDPEKQAYNTIDAGAPTSSVTSLPAITNGATFTVTWSGTDDAGGSGIAFYDVFVATDGGPFASLLTQTTLTSTSFTGIEGHTYSFYSVATDNVGLEQAAPATGQATTRVNVTPIVNAGADADVNEGGTFSGSGSFSDSDGTAWMATVDYGFGVQPLTLNPDNTFDLRHVYAQDGTYAVTVTVTDNDGGVDSDTLTVTVHNLAPLVNAGPDATILAGNAFSQSGSFTDPGADAWTATVDYGDGSGVQPLSLNPDHTFNLSHVYTSPGSYSVTVTVQDDDTTGSDVVAVTVNDVPPSTPTDTDAAADAVAENAANGSPVGLTAFATDPLDRPITYSLLDDAGGRFAIGASSGVVTVANGALLNYEGAAGHTVVVRASNGTLAATQTFTIAVNNVAPAMPTDNDAAADSVVEGATNGTAVGLTAFAADPAGGAVSYALLDNAGGRFAIDATTGVVTVANGALLNYEGTTGHTVAVRASDGSLSATQTFTIAVANAAPSPPLDANPAANVVAEGMANGTAVGLTAFATDPAGGAVSYALLDDAGGRFAIDATTGVVRVANGAALSYAASGGSYAVVVGASDGLLVATQGFTIQVSPPGGGGLTTPVDANGAANAVGENTPAGTTVGLTAFASSTTGPVSYALLDSAGGRFAINATTGVVTVANGALLNYELATGHAITVQASAGASATSQSFAVAVLNVYEAVEVINGDLVVLGTSLNDTIQVSASGSSYVVRVTNTLTTLYTVPAAPVTGHVIVHGLDGHDNLTASGSFAAELYGDAGNDSVTGGTGRGRAVRRRGQRRADRQRRQQRPGRRGGCGPAHRRHRRRHRGRRSVATGVRLRRPAGRQRAVERGRHGGRGGAAGGAARQ